jgi:hypothetical protein
MDRVEEIDRFPWDEEIDQDSSAGKLDFLFEEAERESGQGLLREWPQGLHCM